MQATMTSMSATPPVAGSAARPRPRRRPFTLVVLATLLVLKAALLVLLATGVSLPTQDWLRQMIGTDLLALLVNIPGASGWILGLAVLLIVSAIGLMARRRVGWLLAMVITGVFVASDISGFTSGTTNHVWMLLNIVTVFYLNQSDVREVVGASTALPARQVGHA
jgi:putative copper export protein